MMRSRIRRGWRGTAAAVSLVVAVAGVLAVTGDPQRAAAVVEDRHLPTGAQTVASAPFFDEPGKDFVVAQASDGRLFYNVGGREDDGEMRYESAGWREVPGGVKTNFRPAVVMLYGDVPTVYLAAVTPDGKLMVNHVRADKTFLGWQEPPTGTNRPFFSGGPAVAVNGAQGEPYTEMTIVAPGGQNALYYQRFTTGSGTERGWDNGWTKWGEDNLTTHGVAAAYFDGKVKVVIDKLIPFAPAHIYHADLVPGAQPTWAEVPGGMTLTDDLMGPSVATHSGNVLSVAVKGSTPANADRVQAINLVKTPTGVTWSTWQIVMLKTTRLAPVRISLSTSNLGNLHAYVVGRDRSIGLTALKSAGSGLPVTEGYPGFTFARVPGSDPLDPILPAPTGTDWTTTVGTANYLNPDPWAADATDGPDGVAEARMGSFGDNMLVVRKISDSRLYVSIGRYDEWNAFGWAPIPGALPGGAQATTPYAPSATTFGNDIFVALVGADKKMYYQVFNVTSKVWREAWTEVPGNGRFSGGPTLTVWHGALQAFGPGVDKAPYWLQGNPTWEGSQWLAVGNMKTDKPLAAIEFDNDVVLVARQWSDGSDGRVDGEVRYKALGSFSDGGTSWDKVPGTMLTRDAPAVTQNSGVMHVVVRSTQGRLQYASALGKLTAWRLWGEVPSTGPASAAPAMTRNNSTVNLTMVSDPIHDVWNATFTTDPVSGQLMLDTQYGWRVVPLGQVQDIPLGSDGQPIPAPPPPGTPWTPPAQPVVNWYVFCLSGDSVPDGYIPTLDENQAAGEAQAREFAAAQYGVTGWALTYVATPTAGGCQDPPATPKFIFCALPNTAPPIWWMNVTVFANNQSAAYDKAIDQVTQVHGPQWVNGGQVWRLLINEYCDE